MDYRYFPDPDLLPLVINPEMLKSIEAEMSELPHAMHARFQSQYGLSAYDASTLTADRATADYFEAVVQAGPNDPKISANWVMGEVFALLNDQGKFFDDCPLSPQQLSGLLLRISDGTISNKIAKEVFEHMCQKVGMHYAITSKALHAPQRDPRYGDNLADQIIEEKGLRQISDSGEIEKIVDQVLTANAQQVADYKSGKEKAFNSLVGQVMKASKGKANPAQVNALLKQKLAGN